MRSVAPRFIVVTFYSEGSPWDAGLSLVDEERHFRAVVEPYVDEVRSFCPRSISALWQGADAYCRDYSEWIEQHPLRYQLKRRNPGWEKMGFLAWKPFLLSALLHDDAIRTGDVIFYHDVNLRKYPAYSRTPAEWRAVSLRILDELGCDIFSPEAVRLESDTKAFLVRRYLHESAGLERVVWAGMIVCRKSSQSLEFIDEWRAMCEDIDNLSPLPNPNPYVGAHWHAVDQAVLGVLALKWKQEGRLPAAWPLYAAGDRSFDSQIFKRRASPPSSFERRLYRVFLSLPSALQERMLSIIRGIARLKRRVRSS